MDPDRIVLLVMLLLAAGTFVITAGGQDAGHEREGAQEASRTVDVETGGQEARIDLRPADDAGEDLISVGFSSRNGTLEVRHRPQGDPGGESSLQVILDSWVEYRDENGNGTFDRTEPVASTWRIAQDGRDANGSVEWASPNVTNTSRDGAEGQRVVSAATLGDEGRFEVRLQAFGEPVETRNTTLDPTGVAVSLLLEYPYEANGTDLALLVTARTAEEAEIGTAHGGFTDAEEGVVVTRRHGEQATSLLAGWRTSAIVDGQRRPVETFEQPDVSEARDDRSSPEEEQRRRAQYDGERRAARGGENVTIDQFTLSYERGDRVFHEGKAEVTTASIEGGENGAPALPLAVALAAIATSGWLRQRMPRG